MWNTQTHSVGKIPSISTSGIHNNQCTVEVNSTEMSYLFVCFQVITLWQITKLKRSFCLSPSIRNVLQHEQCEKAVCMGPESSRTFTCPTYSSIQIQEPISPLNNTTINFWSFTKKRFNKNSRGTTWVCRLVTYSSAESHTDEALHLKTGDVITCCLIMVSLQGMVEWWEAGDNWSNLQRDSSAFQPPQIPQEVTQD
jgi:hypothetical protein